MGPFRLLILAVLFYIGYRLLVGGRKKEKRVRKENTTMGKPGTISDVLVEDPVCHCLVPKGQAVHLQHQGSMVYFCSEDCCNKFLKKGNDE
jgi:YHS domain-containing protein